MKLLILSASSPHVMGGAEICAFDIARTFAARHHDVSVMTLAEPDEPEVWNEVTEHGFRLYCPHPKSPRFRAQQKCSSATTLQVSAGQLDRAIVLLWPGCSMSNPTMCRSMS